MENSNFSAIIANRSSENRNHLDFYPTPPSATIALINFLREENLYHHHHNVWEPACGTGDMSSVIRRMGNDVIETDIQMGYDYLTCHIPSGDKIDWVITNPPFKLAKEFILRSAEHNLNFAFLLKSQYWHSASRMSLFKRCKPTFILPLTWRIDFKYKERGQGAEAKGSPTMDHIWAVWKRKWCDPDIIHPTVTIFKPLEKPIKNDYKWYLENLSNQSVHDSIGNCK
jgi:hypothetical protein